MFLTAAISHVECNAAETGGNEDDTGIRNARLAFNRAIREQDIDAIGRFFAPEYHIITGRSQQSHGVAAERNLWASTFAADPTFVCRRDTRENWVTGIAVSPHRMNPFIIPASTRPSGNARWAGTG